MGPGDSCLVFGTNVAKGEGGTYEEYVDSYRASHTPAGIASSDRVWKIIGYVVAGIGALIALAAFSGMARTVSGRGRSPALATTGPPETVPLAQATGIPASGPAAGVATGPALTTPEIPRATGSPTAAGIPSRAQQRSGTLIELNTYPIPVGLNVVSLLAILVGVWSISSGSGIWAWLVAIVGTLVVLVFGRLLVSARRARAGRRKWAAERGYTYLRQDPELLARLVLPGLEAAEARAFDVVYGVSNGLPFFVFDFSVTSWMDKTALVVALPGRQVPRIEVAPKGTTERLLGTTEPGWRAAFPAIAPRRPDPRVETDPGALLQPPTTRFRPRRLASYRAVSADSISWVAVAFRVGSVAAMPMLTVTIPVSAR
jgi:hypothetical protein